MSDPSDLDTIDSLNNFRDLMQRVRQGSEDAAWELVRRYGGYMRRAVRRVLGRTLRPKFDSLDFVQLAWHSFFRMRDQADRFEKPQHLVTFLAGVAARKVHMESRRRLGTDKYDVAREVPLPDHSTEQDGESVSYRSEPEPVDVAIARERWEQLLEDQPAHYRQIIELKLQGHTHDEIAAVLGIDRMTVHRFLKRLLRASAA